MTHPGRVRTSEIVQRRARELRKQMTAAETLLWERLRDRRLAGFKFRRQAPIDHYIVDFYCPERRLILEIDGIIHASQADLDQERTDYLVAKGYRVIRFQNEAVEQNTSAVLKAILTACQELP